MYRLSSSGANGKFHWRRGSGLGQNRAGMTVGCNWGPFGGADAVNVGAAVGLYWRMGGVLSWE